MIETLITVWVFCVGLLAGRWVHDRWRERRQRERMRRFVNGGRANMPPWLRRREEQLQRGYRR